MIMEHWAQVSDLFSWELTALRQRAAGASHDLNELRMKSEQLKIAALRSNLESQKDTLFRTRGSAIARDYRNIMGIGLGIAAASAILGGIASKDGWQALGSGGTAFSNYLKGLGETDCAVFLGKHLMVVEKSRCTEGIYATWKSVQAALSGLMADAANGISLGNLESIILRVQKKG